MIVKEHNILYRYLKEGKFNDGFHVVVIRRCVCLWKSQITFNWSPVGRYVMSKKDSSPGIASLTFRMSKTASLRFFQISLAGGKLKVWPNSMCFSFRFFLNLFCIFGMAWQFKKQTCSWKFLNSIKEHWF